MRLLGITAAVSLIVSTFCGVLMARLLTAPVQIIGHFFRLTLTHNTGIAFSMSLPSPWQEILILSALVVVCVVASRTKRTTLTSIAFGMIVGGALANVLDRSLHGFVTDFISIGTFPVFNVADAAISIGAGLLLLEGWMERPKTERKK